MRAASLMRGPACGAALMLYAAIGSGPVAAADALGRDLW